MFSTIRGLAGHVKVTESKDVIRISGIHAGQLAKDFMSVWGTSRIAKNMFIRASGRDLSFPSFFALDVEFVLTELIHTKSRIGTPKRMLVQTLDQLRENTWIVRTKIKHPGIVDKSRLSDLTYKLFDYQDEFLDIYNDRVPRYGLKGYILGASAGTGKTILALSLMHCLKVDTVFVVSPMNAVTEVWEDTIKELFKQPQSYWTSAKGGSPVLGKRFYVVHYEHLAHLKEFLDTNHGSLGKIGLIVDESHNFNELSRDHSLRIRLLTEIGLHKSVKHFLPQSGTPIKAMGTEVIPILKILDPLFSADSELRFRAIFGREAKRAIDILANRIGLLTFKVESLVKEPIYHQYHVSLPNGKEFTLKEISRKMRVFISERMRFYEDRMEMYTKQYFDGIRKAELGAKGRIPKTKLDEYLRITEELHKRYDPMVHKTEPKLANDFERVYILPNLNPADRRQFSEARSVYKYYHLKVQGEALGGILGRERTRCNVEITKHLDQMVDKSDPKAESVYSIEELIDRAASKTVIFTSYVDVVDAMVERLEAKGYKPLKVYGETNKDLTNIRAQFQSDPAANPLVATFKSLSTAVPLVMASTTVMLNQPFRDYEREQAVARTRRVGQVHNVHIKDVYLDTGDEPNISTRSKDILEWSRDQVANIMGRTVVTTASMESYLDIELLPEHWETTESKPEPVRARTLMW